VLACLQWIVVALRACVLACLRACLLAVDSCGNSCMFACLLWQFMLTADAGSIDDKHSSAGHSGGDEGKRNGNLPGWLLSGQMSWMLSCSCVIVDRVLCIVCRALLLRVPCRSSFRYVLR
jgi:hypothetical protein